jgi:hypothetical protein
MLNTFIALHPADVNHYGSPPDEQEARWDPKLGGISEHPSRHFDRLVYCLVLY